MPSVWQSQDVGRGGDADAGGGWSEHEEEAARLLQTSIIRRQIRVSMAGEGEGSASGEGSTSDAAGKGETDLVTMYAELTSELAAVLAEVELYKRGWNTLLRLPGLARLPETAVELARLPSRLRSEARTIMPSPMDATDGSALDALFTKGGAPPAATDALFSRGGRVVRTRRDGRTRRGRC